MILILKLSVFTDFDFKITKWDTNNFESCKIIKITWLQSEYIQCRKKESPYSRVFKNRSINLKLISG